MAASYPTSAKSFTTKNSGESVQATHVNDLQDEVTAVEQDLIGGLPIARGGTGLTSLTANRIPYGNGTSALQSSPNLTFDGSSLAVTGGMTVTGGLTVTGDVFTTAWTDYTATSTITGWASFTAGRKFVMYKRVGKTVFVAFHLEGTSNATGVSFTLPLTAVTVGSVFAFGALLPVARDNGAVVSTYAYCALDNNSATVNCYASSAGGAWTNSGTKIVSGQFWYETA